MSACGWSAAAGVILLFGAIPLTAQDSAAVAGGRAGRAIDSTRALPFARTYDMLVHTGDSVSLIGRRTISVVQAPLAGAPAWLVVETRSGAVPAVDSLYLSPGMWPLSWASRIGPARLAFAFSRDSIYGVTSGPAGRRNVIHSARSDVVASVAMLEVLLPLLPLSPYWRDSVQVLQVDHASAGVLPGELAVIGEDRVTGRDAWIVVLRASGQSVLFWVDTQTGALLRLQQPLPLHIGSLLEYRPIDSAVPSPIPPDRLTRRDFEPAPRSLRATGHRASW